MSQIIILKNKEAEIILRVFLLYILIKYLVVLLLYAILYGYFW